ncbi:MAG: NAD(P)/FAD-dependent oxidoreductase [Chloroflexota bacterium]|nr:NAD(P)/FAD-dependent oxidoreductase [Chloroflexota bacterium]MDQ5865403.1 NAD(P)/FAD-dependent oxidoreductase [Chloroflexota bacterium]
MESKHTHVIVVGGGLSGLTTAAYLARAGKSVTLFEKASSLGGRARTQEVNGFRFNMGPHALYLGGEACKVLREFGVVPTGRKPRPKGCVYDGGELYPLPADGLSFFRSKVLSRAAKMELLGFFSKALLLKPQEYAHVTLRKWLDTEFRQPDARAFIEALARTITYTNAPEYQSVDEFLAQLKVYAKGNVLYMDGGWQTLVEGMRRAAVEQGVEIVTGGSVESVCYEEKRHVVKLANGSVRTADTVIVATDPSTAGKLIEGGQNTTLREWAAAAKPVRAACLNLGLRRLPEPGNRFGIGLDAPLYVSVHSDYARLAPEGQVMLHLIKYLHPDAQEQPQQDEQELEHLLDLMQPGWREEVVARSYLPRMTVINAMSLAANGGLEGRPGPEVPGIPNLYVVGDWVGKQGSLLDAALASARTAAQMVLAGAREESRHISPEVRRAQQPEYQLTGS